MPTYEYRCESCRHQVEVFARMSDPAPAACEECGGSELVKVLFPVAVHYKGSGFYSTDYAGKGKAPASESSSSDSSSSDSSSNDSSSSSSADSGSTGTSGDSGGSSASTPAPSASSD